MSARTHLMRQYAEYIATCDDPEQLREARCEQTRLIRVDRAATVPGGSDGE
jgi:hypothetical protein